MRNKRKSLFVVSAPSGAGKTTLCRKLCEMVPDIRHSVSYTTRKPRPGEEDGEHYNFITEEKFRAMVADGEFIEWAEVYGNLYGTSGKAIGEMIGRGLDVILDIDVQGAKQIKGKVPGIVFIFVLPPSMEVLRDRLTGRMSDSPEVVKKRLGEMSNEIREYENYDYVIINDTFDIALNELLSVVTSERTKISKVDHDWIRENFFKEE